MTTPDEDRRDTEKLYNRMTVEDLYEKVSSVRQPPSPENDSTMADIFLQYFNISTIFILQDFDWMAYLNGIFANVTKNVTRKEEVVVYAPDFLKDMVALVKKTPKRHLCILVCFILTCTSNHCNIYFIIFRFCFTEQ